MRKLCILVATVVCSTALAFAQGTAAAAIPITINQSGAPIPSVLVTVCTTNPGTGACPVKVSTYTDITLGTACSGTLKALNNLSAPSVGSDCSNPGYSDGLGNVLVFAAAGANWCQFSGSGLTTYSQPCIFPFAGVGSVAWQNVTGPGPNVNPLQMGAGGSLRPATGTNGQIAGTQTWITPGLVVPSMSFALTGGSFQTGRMTSVRYTFTSALGQTTASISANGGNSTFGCSSGSTCKLTVSHPTLPSGYTSWSTYAQDCGASPCGGSEQLQAGCTNLGPLVDCVLTSVGAGASVPTANTAIVQPTNVLDYSGSCPPGTLPSVFTPDVSGNYHAWIAMNMGDPLTGQTAGTPTFCYRTYFRDDAGSNPTYSAQFQTFKNAFVSINHLAGKNTDAAGTQDRGLAVNLYTPAGDTTSRYGLEAIQAELDYFCSAPCVGPTGSPDGEVTVASLQLADLAANHWGTVGESGVVRGTYSNSTVGNNAVMNVFDGVLNFGKTAYTNGDTANVVIGKCGGTNQAATMTGLACYGYQFVPAGGLNVFGGGQSWAFIRQGVGVGGTYTPQAGKDHLIQNDVRNYDSYLDGPVELNQIINSDVAALPINASVVVNGSLGTGQISASGWAPVTASCSGGASSYSYVLVAVDGNGGTVNSATISTGLTVCTNPLTSGNPVTIPAVTLPVIGASNALNQSIRIDVYRTAGPMATGKVGSINCAPASGFAFQRVGCSTFVDTGLAASGTLPTGNSTGSIVTVSSLRTATAGGSAPGNTDFAGKLAFAAATTASYTFINTNQTAAPVCVVTAEFPAATATVSISTLSATTLTVTASAAVTGTVDYICAGRN